MKMTVRLFAMYPILRYLNWYFSIWNFYIWLQYIYIHIPIDRPPTFTHLHHTWKKVIILATNWLLAPRGQKRRKAVENDVKLSKLTQSQRKMYISTFKCTSILILSFQQELFSLLRKLKFICTHLRSRTWARAAWYGRDGRVGHWRRRYLPQQQGQVQHQRPGTVQRLDLYITKHLICISRL